MTLFTEKGTFTKRASTGSQEVNLTGAFQPKALILWTTGQTTIDGTYLDDYNISLGFSDGTNDASQMVFMDESAEFEGVSIRNDAIIEMINPVTAAICGRANVTTFDADGFTLNWSVSDGSARYIHYLAIGGTDITNVSVVSTTVGSTGTGNLSFTGSGTSFQPDFAFMFAGPDAYTTVNTYTSSGDQAIFNIGAAVSTSKRFVAWARDETVGTSDCDSYINNDACLASCSISTGAITFLADFVSFNNAAGGGITVNVSDPAEASTKLLAFLFIKGGVWNCGTFTQRTGTGTQDVTLDSGLDPALVFLVGTEATTNATVTANAYMSIGASDGTNEGCSFVANTNGLGTFQSAMCNTNAKALTNTVPTTTASSSTVNRECDVTDMTTAGQFTLNWTINSAGSRLIGFWVVGTTAAGAGPIAQTVYLEWEEV